MSGILQTFLMYKDVVANTHSIDLESNSSQYLSITDGDQTGLDLSSDFTIEAWINLKSLPPLDGTEGLIKKWETDGEYSYQMFLRNRSSGGTSIAIYVSSTGSFSSYDYFEWYYTYSTGSWIHIAISYDISSSSASKAILYVNGTAQSDADTLTRSITSIYNGTSPFIIGRGFDGLMDDVRIWNDIRTATEISDNYKKELTGSESNLQGYWKLNNSLLDETANNNDLTNNNSAAFSTDVPFS